MYNLTPLHVSLPAQHILRRSESLAAAHGCLDDGACWRLPDTLALQCLR